MRQIVAALSLAASIVCATSPYGAETQTETQVDGYTIECKGIESVLQSSLKMDAKTLQNYDSAKTITFIDGVLAYRYGGTRGTQISPWLASTYALRHLEQFCKDRDLARLPKILAQRDWLAKNLVARKSGAEEFLVIPYDFPNPPYSSKPGWTSALAQASTLSLLARVRPKQHDPNVEMVAAAFAIPAVKGGLYSDYDRATIWWEEVATPERPSMVVNGGAIALYILAADLDVLPITTPLHENLAVKIEKAKRALLLMLPRLVPSEGKILYDLSGTNFRNKGHYAHIATVEVLSWMQTDGYLSAAELKTIAELKK